MASASLIRRAGLWLLVLVQLVCTGFFIWNVTAGLFAFRTRPISWQAQELIEIGAAIGLLLGVSVGLATLLRTLKRNAHVEEKLRIASGAFGALLEERFKDWNLTPAEQDVAWFTLKGFSLAEIAALRNTSEGTVKAQSNAIYRKAGVSGRTQLLSLFIEDLLDERPGTAAPAEDRKIS